jgi:hypothetical protein
MWALRCTQNRLESVAISSAARGMRSSEFPGNWPLLAIMAAGEGVLSTADWLDYEVCCLIFLDLTGSPRHTRRNK